jgi:hypothetical protein
VTMATSGPSDGGHDDFDSNATLQGLFTPPGIEQAENASPIIRSKSTDNTGHGYLFTVLTAVHLDVVRGNQSEDLDIHRISKGKLTSRGLGLI